MPRQSDLENRILSRLPASDFELIADGLEPVELKVRAGLVEKDTAVDFIHFLEAGISSVVAHTPEGLSIESGIIGREGFVHPGLVLGSERIPYDVFIQVPGHGYRIARTHLLRALEESRSLQERLSLYSMVHSIQVSFTALSNSVHPIDERLARWLLMCHDRSASDDLPLTHEFMSLMLAVRRPSVTTALHTLEGNRFITSTRGYVGIRNRRALEEFASDTYGKPEAEYRRLLGPL